MNEMYRHVFLVDNTNQSSRTYPVCPLNRYCNKYRCSRIIHHHVIRNDHATIHSLSENSVTINNTPVIIPPEAHHYSSRIPYTTHPSIPYRVRYSGYD